MISRGEVRGKMVELMGMLKWSFFSCGFDGKQMALKWDEPAKYGGWGRVFGDLDMIKGVI